MFRRTTEEEVEPMVENIETFEILVANVGTIKATSDSNLVFDSGSVIVASLIE